MGWELRQRGSRRGLYVSFIYFHGSWVSMSVMARLGTGAGGGSRVGSRVNIRQKATEEGLGVSVDRVGKGGGPSSWGCWTKK